MKQFTIITKDGSKWLRPTDMHDERHIKDFALPYIGSHPEGTVLDESEVTAITQARNKEYSSSNWFSISENDADWDDFELRTAYTDTESHDRHISDDYWRKRCEAAERYISESPCDPDITPDQIEAYATWQELVEQEN